LETWVATIDPIHVSQKRPLFFPSYKFLARPIQILKSEIFQGVFGGFMELCRLDSVILTA